MYPCCSLWKEDKFSKVVLVDLSLIC